VACNPHGWTKEADIVIQCEAYVGVFFVLERDSAIGTVAYVGVFFVVEKQIPEPGLLAYHIATHGDSLFDGLQKSINKGEGTIKHVNHSRKFRATAFRPIR